MSRVLVVEADPGLRQGVVRMLQRLGHTPLPADDAPAALRALARKRVDVVLMDIDMPAPGGFGLLRQINEGEHPPVVGMGTDPEADDIILLMRLGGVDFVRRPVSLEVLDGALARAAAAIASSICAHGSPCAASVEYLWPSALGALPLGRTVPASMPGCIAPNDTPVVPAGNGRLGRCRVAGPKTTTARTNALECESITGTHVRPPKARLRIVGHRQRVAPPGV